MLWQSRLVAPLRRRSFPSTRHQLNLGLVQYFDIFCHKKKIRQFFWPHHMEYFFSKILKSWICPWFEEWSYFPWIFRFICYKLYLHFVETKNLRVDSPGDLDFPQLENSLQVKPFLLTPISLIRHKKDKQTQNHTHNKNTKTCNQAQAQTSTHTLFAIIHIPPIYAVYLM